MELAFKIYFALLAFLVAAIPMGKNPLQAAFTHLAALALLLSGPGFAALAVYAASMGDWGDAALFFILSLLSVGVLIAISVFVLRGSGKTADLKSKPKDNAEAKSRVVQLRAQDALSGDEGMLIGANWDGADLHDVNFSKANLRQIHLESANLSGANLRGSNLRSAIADNAIFAGANLSGANLMYARLVGANLTKARLTGTDLTAADLTGALLSGANLLGAKLDEFTTLPDGTRWTPTTNLTTFVTRR